MQERLSFLFGKQNLACVLASLHLPIVQFMRHSFSDLLIPSSWHVAAWKWLLEKHPIARQAFFAVSSLSKRAIDSPQTSWSIFTLLVIQVKIVVIEPAKPISARCFR